MILCKRSKGIRSKTRALRFNCTAEKRQKVYYAFNVTEHRNVPRLLVYESKTAVIVCDDTRPRTTVVLVNKLPNVVPPSYFVGRFPKILYRSGTLRDKRWPSVRGRTDDNDRARETTMIPQT